MINKPTYQGEKLLTVKEAAEILNLKPQTLYNGNFYKSFPEMGRVKIGGRLFYKLSCITTQMQ